MKTGNSKKHNFIILGSGLCGLSSAYHLEKRGGINYIVLERDHEIGGLVRTETYDGFSFDHSIHIFYTNDTYIDGLVCKNLLKGNLRKQVRKSYCFSAGTFTEYPYQVNNYGLSSDIIIENILGLIEAHYSSHKNLPPHFEAWIYRTFGRGIAEHFMVPYNRRQWAWDLKDMSCEWIAGRVPRPEIKEALMGALKPPVKKFGPNREFLYPIEGGIETLAKAFLKYIPKERVLFKANVTAINGPNHEVRLENGRSFCYDRLISSLPLPTFIDMLGESVPKSVRISAEALKHNIVHTINIGLEGSELNMDKFMHWVYFAGSTTIFHRISFPHNFSEWMVPHGCSSIQAEVSESSYRVCNRSMLIKDTLDGLVRVGILKGNEAKPVSKGGRVRVAKIVSLNPAYIIYGLKHKENKKIVIDYLETLDIDTKGRFGEWEYLNMDQAILSGKKSAEVITGKLI